MSIKSRSENRIWEAKQQLSASSTVWYSGTSLLSKDDLDISVSDAGRGDHPFLSNHILVEGSIGQRYLPIPSNGNGKYFITSGPSSISTNSPSYAPKLYEFDAAMIYARTNPSRPTVLLPVFLLELKDVPDMIRQAGRFLQAGVDWQKFVRRGSETRDLATANLAFQFGWAPLLGDLWKMVQFSESVEKRRKEINRLYSSKGLKRRIKLGTNTVRTSFSGNVNFGSYRNFPTTFTRVSETKSWAVVRWKPTQPSVLPPSDGTLRFYLNGLHPSHILSNVWEALPWSWLVDYFTNIGNIINAGNRYLATPVGGVTMTQRTSVVSHPSLYAGLDMVTAGSVKYWQNSRALIGSTLDVNASLPNLGAGQLAVLSSLAVLKAPKRFTTGWRY